MSIATMILVCPHGKFQSINMNKTSNHHGENEPSAIYLHNAKYDGFCLQYIYI